jgi:hypothetical protein
LLRYLCKIDRQVGDGSAEISWAKQFLQKKSFLLFG